MRIIPLILILLTGNYALADSFAYSGKHDCETRRDELHAVHYHNWSSPKIPELFLDLGNHEAFLKEVNDFAYIELSNSDGEFIFRQPSSALTYIWISPDHKYIVGLSTVMLYNPYQLIVWEIDGDLIHKEHISCAVALLSKEAMREFRQKFSQATEFLSNRIKPVGDYFLIDYEILGIPNHISAEAWRFLYERRVPHLYSADFSSSVTNWINWYDEDAPNIRIEESVHKTTLIVTSLTGRDMRIEIAAPQ